MLLSLVLVAPWDTPVGCQRRTGSSQGAQQDWTGNCGLALLLSVVPVACRCRGKPVRACADWYVCVCMCVCACVRVCFMNGLLTLGKKHGTWVDTTFSVWVSNACVGTICCGHDPCCCCCVGGGRSTVHSHTGGNPGRWSALFFPCTCKGTINRCV